MAKYTKRVCYTANFCAKVEFEAPELPKKHDANCVLGTPYDPLSMVTGQLQTPVEADFNINKACDCTYSKIYQEIEDALFDAMTDVDIPEGGKNNSVYLKESFDEYHIEDY